VLDVFVVNHVTEKSRYFLWEWHHESLLLL